MHRIPRWKLEEQERERKHLESEKLKNERLMNTEENFPSLGKSQIPVKAGVWGVKRGADLAKEWAEHEEQRKMNEEFKKQQKERDEVYTFSMPTFHNAGYYPEEQDDYEEEEETVNKLEHNELVEDGWVDVKKKVRKVKPVKESDSEESEEEKKEETVWGGEDKELHETCWEGRY
jgi:hypothetical protein